MCQHELFCGIKGHTAYYGCDRCVQSGKWLNKMTFPEVAARKRTHADFCLKTNDEHHIGDCPLTVGWSLTALSTQCRSYRASLSIDRLIS